MIKLFALTSSAKLNVCAWAHGHTHTHTHTHTHIHMHVHSHPHQVCSPKALEHTLFQGFGSASEFQTVYPQPVHSLPFPATF